MLAAYRLAQGLNALLPADVCLRLADALADRYWRGRASDCLAVRENLSAALGSQIDADSPLVRDVFRNFARYLEEFLRAPRLSGARLTVEGTEALTALLQAHPGCVVLSAHVGNWELGGILIRRLGFPFSAVFLPHQHSGVNRVFDEQRLRCGVGVIPLGVGATPKCLAWLRAGKPLGVMGDREFGSNGVRVSLFGRSATLPRGPAMLSLRTGAPAIPIFLIREGPWRFRFHTQPPIWPSSVSGADRIRTLTQQYALAIERVVRLAPTQWLLFRPLVGVG